MVVDSQICSDPVFILNQLGTNVPKLKNNLYYIDLIFYGWLHTFSLSKKQCSDLNKSNVKANVPKYSASNSIKTVIHILAMIAPLVVQLSTPARIHNAITFVDTSNNSSYNQAHWPIGMPYLQIIASNDL